VVGLLLAGLFTGGLFSAGLWVAAALVVPALLVGRIGLPGAAEALEPGPRRLRIHEHLHVRALAAFPRLHFLGGVGLHFHALNVRGLRELPQAVRTPFGRFFPVMLARDYGMNATVSSLIYAVAAGVGIALFILASRWAERYGSGRVYQLGLWGRLLGFVLLLLPLAVRTGHSFLLAAIGLVLIVLTWPLLSVAGTGLAARLAPFSEGAAMGLFNGALAFATVIGTFASGPLLHRYGFTVVPVMAVAGIALAIVLGLRLPASHAAPQAATQD
jgi:hypothetical protein